MRQRSDKDQNKVQNPEDAALDGGELSQIRQFQGRTKAMDFKSRLRTNLSRKKTGLSRLQIREIADCAELDRADTVGAALKAARLRLDKDTCLVAEDLKIKRAYIEALESGRFENLPSMIYVRGFVRSYASYLGLDAEECLFRFKSETAAVTTPQVPVFLKPKPEVQLPQGSLFILAALLAVGLYGGWFLSVAADRMVIERAPAPAPITGAGHDSTAGLPGGVAPLSARAMGGPDLEIRAPQERDSAAPSRALAVDGGHRVALSGPEDVITLQSLLAAAVPPQDKAPLNPETGHRFGLAAGAGRLVLRARSPAWIRVEDSASQVLIQQNLQTGDRYFAPDEDGLILSARDAGALEVFIDGAYRGVLGRAGQPLPAVLLDPGAAQAPDPS